MAHYISDDCFIPDDAEIDLSATIGPRVTLAGRGIEIRARARIDGASVIGENVVIEQGAWVRAGAVVLRSVPPNGIVQGNPAVLVGYVNRPQSTPDTPAKVIDTTVFGKIAAPARVDLHVGSSALHLMRSALDTRGALTVGEFSSELPFRPERYFIVYDVPSSELRGEHAHKNCHQFLICIHGSCRILLDDGKDRCEVTLDRPDIGVHMPPMIWGTQYRYTRDATLLVFASEPYDNHDYIRDYDEFLNAIESSA